MAVKDMEQISGGEKELPVNFYDNDKEKKKERMSWIYNLLSL